MQTSKINRKKSLEHKREKSIYNIFHILSCPNHKIKSHMYVFLLCGHKLKFREIKTKIMAKYNQCLIHNQNRFLIKKLQDLINEIMKILCMLLSLRHCQTLIKKIKWHHNTISRTLKNTITKVGIISQISLFS